MRIHPGRSLTGKVNIPGDKSISHRAILLSSLAAGTSRIENILIAGVTEKMLAALEDLGVSWQLKGSTLSVVGRGLHGLRSPEHPLDCGNSATTMRLLVGACSAAGIAVILTGSPGLRSRPMLRVVTPLQEMGVQIQAGGEKGTAPIQISARSKDQLLNGINYTSPIASAQVKSAVLLAGLAARDPVQYLEPSASRDHTERMLSTMGVEIHRRRNTGNSIQVTMAPLHGKSLDPLELTIPGDISSASFLIVAALITPGSVITIPHVGLNPTRTGLLEVLKEMGAAISVQQQAVMGGEPVGEITARYSQLKGIRLSGSRVVRMIDEIPIFAVAAAYAAGETLVEDALELRYKESDRIASLQQGFSQLGAEFEELKDGFRLQGGAPLHGGVVDACGDHRIAMSMAVAGLAAKNPVRIEDSEIIRESFPAFIKTLQEAGGELTA